MRHIIREIPSHCRGVMEIFIDEGICDLCGKIQICLGVEGEGDSPVGNARFSDPYDCVSICPECVRCGVEEYKEKLKDKFVREG